MKLVAGIWLPDGEGHLVPHLVEGRKVDGLGTYQLKKYVVAKRFIREFGRALDIGAHVGTWARVMAKDFTEVVCFEPNPAHTECLRKNLAGADYTLYEVALGRESGGVVAMTTPEISHTMHSVVHPGGELLAPLMALDGYGLKGVDFIKIDVDGYEYEVILGAERTIRDNRPVMVVEQKPGQAERYGRGQLDAVEMLQSWGMRQLKVMGGDHLLVWD